MKRIFIALAALAALSTPAFAATHHARMNCGWPHPDAGCATTTPNFTPVPKPSPTKDVLSIGTALLKDFTAAQTEAGPATAPIDPVGYACYSTVVNSLNGFAQQSPEGIVSTGEAIWLLAQTANKVALDQNCQSVCGRVQMLAGKIGGLLGSLTVPNVCGAFTSLAE